jgi:acetyl-CoA C-acetyltransferase
MGDAYRELYEVTSQGEAAERIADLWSIDRAECDEVGLRSQTLAADAWAAGRFDDELLPLVDPRRVTTGVG